MKFVYDDGGRAESGFKGTTGDCVCRAFAIASNKTYKEVYDLINEVSKEYYENVYSKKKKKNRKGDGKSSARTGVYREETMIVAERLGGRWIPTMKIGSGCTTHLREDELPKGRIVCDCSRHNVAVIDGVIHDIDDPSREGNRCVYGYWIFEQDGGKKMEKNWEAQKRYDEKNTKMIPLKLNKKTDADILEWLEHQESNQGAIKEAIREYISK